MHWAQSCAPGLAVLLLLLALFCLLLVWVDCWYGPPCLLHRCSCADLCPAACAALQMHSPEVAKDALLLQQLATMANLCSLQLIGSSVSCSTEEAAACAVSLSALTQLTELELSECRGWLSAEVLLKLVGPLCRLQVLRLHRCADISVQGLQQVVAGQQEVRRVELSGCEGLGRREARELRRALLGSRAGVEVCVVQELLA
jgi:hypothetical protein